MVDCQKCDYHKAFTRRRTHRSYRLCFFCITKGIKPSRKQYMSLNQTESDQMSLRNWNKKESKSRREVLEDYYFDRYKKDNRKFDKRYHVPRVKKKDVNKK